MPKSHRSRTVTRNTARDDAIRTAEASPIGSDNEQNWVPATPIEAGEIAVRSEFRKKHQQKDPKPQKQKQHTTEKKKKKPAIVGFFRRFKLRPLWRRSRSRGRRRRDRSTPSPSEDETDAIGLGRPGSYDLRIQPVGRFLLGATAFASSPLNAWGCPYDFAIQGDRLLVPGLDVAEFSLTSCARQSTTWPANLGQFVPLCIDATPGLVYMTASSLTRCGLFVFDRSGRLATFRLQAPPAVYEVATPAAGDRNRRPGMFAVRVNFRGECWVTNPRDLSVDHYAPELKRIRSIDVARFGVPYYLAAHSHRYICLWVSFTETRRVVKFDWLTLEPLCHLAYDVGQSPCGLHLDELGDQLYVTDITGSRMLVYYAATMGIMVSSTRAVNEAVAAVRPAAVRLSGRRLLLLSCSGHHGRCQIDVYTVAFDQVDGSN